MRRPSPVVARPARGIPRRSEAFEADRFDSRKIERDAQASKLDRLADQAVDDLRSQGLRLRSYKTLRVSIGYSCFSLINTPIKVNSFLILDLKLSIPIDEFYFSA